MLEIRIKSKNQNEIVQFVTHISERYQLLSKLAIKANDSDEGHHSFVDLEEKGDKEE